MRHIVLNKKKKKESGRIARVCSFQNSAFLSLTSGYIKINNFSFFIFLIFTSLTHVNFDIHAPDGQIGDEYEVEIIEFIFVYIYILTLTCAHTRRIVLNIVGKCSHFCFFFHFFHFFK